MNAFVLEAPTGPAGLRLTTLPTPPIGPEEVLVQVRAISLNPVDAKSAAGKAFYNQLKAEQPLILGWDVAGTVAAVGADVRQFAVGDGVFGMVNFPGHGRAYAEQVAAPAAHLARMPEGVSFAAAAATTLAALTAWQALFDQVNLQPGERVLIHAAAGGVGHFAVQLAKERGAVVVGTGSGPRREFVLGLGAAEFVDYTQQQYEDVVAPVDVVFDSLGADNCRRSLAVLKPGGRLVSILGGANADWQAAAAERGVTGMSYLVQSSGADMEQLAVRLADGRLRAHVGTTYPFAKLPEALRAMESGHTQGKIVVEV